MKTLAVGLLFLAFTTTSIDAASRLFEFSLDGNGVIPANNSLAAAHGTIAVHQNENTLTVSLRVAGLSNAPTTAAIIRNGESVIQLPLGDFSQNFAVTPSQLAELRAGEWRVKLSSVAFPNGEIGGRVYAVASDTNVTFPSSNGSLDATFGNAGIVATEMRGSNNVAQAVAVQPDGKIVVAGFDRGTNEDFAVARYNPDGTLDVTFDTDGYVTTSTVAGEEVGFAVALYPDGRIVVAGQVSNGANNDIGVVRYNADGSLDTIFNGQGFVRTPIGPGSDLARTIAVQPDGKIVVAGQSFNGVNNDVVVVRYNLDGSLDETFDGVSGNGNGIVTTAVGPGNDLAYGVAIQDDGKIVVAGYYFSGTTNDALLMRYNPDGSLDPQFDGDGIVTASAGTATDEAFAVTIQTDGKIVFAGCTNSAAPNDFLIGRLNSDGSRDVGFGSNGLTVTPIGAGAEFANAVAIQADGKIVAAGFSSNGANNDFAVVRKNADGSADTSFDSDGILTTPLGASVDSANGVAIQADGKIVAVGRTVGATADFGVVRYGYGTNVATNDGFIGIDPAVDLRFANAFGRGTTSSAAINSVGIPPLVGSLRHLITPRALSTSAVYNGSIDLKLTLPSRIGATEFASAKVLSLENGIWTDRAASAPPRDFASRTIFARVTSLSVFAVVSSGSPQSDLADLTGRIFRDGSKPADAILALSEINGNPVNSRTNPFGYFRFRSLTFGRTYLLTIRSKRSEFRRILLNFDEESPTNFSLPARAASPRF